MAAVYGTYKPNKLFSVGLGTDYLSGDEISGAGTRSTSFNPLYGTHHKFYGHMDYFYVASPHRNTGLWDTYLTASCIPGKKTGIQLAIHHFTSAVKILNYQNENVSSYLGNEIDLSFNYNVFKDVKITGGYAHMLPASSMKYIKNIGEKQKLKTVQNWVWISIAINPDINIFKRVIQNNQE